MMSWSAGFGRAAIRPLWQQIYRRSLAVQRDPIEQQQKLVRKLLPVLAGTARDRDEGLKSIRSYEDYLAGVRPTAYSDYASYVERIGSGESGVLSAGPVRAMVQTSGTSGYLNKHIPYDDGMLKASTRYQLRVAATIGALCPNVNPAFDARLSYATVVRNTTRTVGNIRKANASELWSVRSTPWLGRRGQVLTADTLDAPDWETKLRQIDRAAAGRDIRIVTGIPLYLVGIFEHLVRARKVDHLTTCFPGLEVVFYSGSGVAPYRDRLNALAGRPLRYFAGYLASEGLFGLPSPDGTSMLFNVDDFLFAFRPSDSSAAENKRLLGLHELEIGKEYEIFVGCPNGFLNFAVGDLIRVETLLPYLTFSVLGRSLSINVANEKTSQARLERVVRELETLVGQPIRHYFVHPDSGEQGLPSYVWTLICDAPESLAGFDLPRLIDDILIEQAPDYADCRVSDGLIGAPRVQVLPAAAGLQDQLFAMNQDKGQYKMKSVYRSADEFAQAVVPAARRSGVELVM